MENSEKTSRAHRALAYLYALIGALVLVLLFTVDETEIKPGGLLLFLVLFGGLFALHYSIAKAARAEKPWARIASIVIGVLFLPGFPIGTLIGVLLLVYAWKPWDGSASPGKSAA